MTTYFTTNSLVATNIYSDPTTSTMSAYAGAFAGGSGSSPQNGLLDRDGDVRKYGIGAFDGEPYATEWTNAIKELVGI